jgi:amino-acid N-acetyltransferase
MPPRIERAGTGDRAGIEQLLERNRLPVDGLADHLATAIVARAGDRIVGSAALEVYADGALLRSVAVADDQRGTGLGQELTMEAIRLAQSLDLPAMYLLTTTAERFFPKFGFQTIARHDVPASVQQSVEFTSACPASAMVMRKLLAPTKL